MHQQQELHPIIDTVIDCIRKRTDENENGERIVVEEFVLPDEFVPLIQDKLLAIQEEEEKREALLSIFAFSIMVETQGWPDNAMRIRELAMVLGEIYYELQRTIANRLGTNAAQQVDQFIGTDSDNAPSKEQDFDQDDTFDPTLDDDF